MHGEAFAANEQRILDLLLSDPGVLLQFDIYTGDLCVPGCQERERKWHRCDHIYVSKADAAIAQQLYLPLDVPILASVIFPFLAHK